MGIKKSLSAMCLAVAVFGAVSIPASADVIGGWSEEQGYFINDTLSSVSEFAALASTATHKASFSYKKPGSQTYERVTGETTWSGVYHYSRARYETWLTGKAEADSGRVFGTGYSKATSGWHPGDFARAKTYYGK